LRAWLRTVRSTGKRFCGKPNSSWVLSTSSVSERGAVGLAGVLLRRGGQPMMVRRMMMDGLSVTLLAASSAASSSSTFST
jgi:hypothetical protein